MLSSPIIRRGTIAALALTSALAGTQMLRAQGRNDRDRDPYADRYRNGRYDAYSRVAEIEPGTLITVRTQQAIDTDRRNDRPFTAVVEDDVWDYYKRLAVPMIKRGSRADLTVRTARDGDLILDLDSVVIGGQRYTVAASSERVDANQRDGRDDRNNNTAGYIGGGAILGSIVGAIAGGGKGAAIGAVAGAAAGAAGSGLMTQGRHLRVPAGSLLTFRLDQPLAVAVAGRGRR